MDATLKPVMTADSGDGENTVTIEAFRRGEVSVRQLLAERFGIWAENSGRREENSEERGYVDSGLWYKSRDPETGALEISVQVGCACIHDCCGHLCQYRLSIVLSPDHILVSITKGYNY